MKTRAALVGALVVFCGTSVWAASVESGKTAQWIGTGETCWDWRSPARPAPTFRRAFELDGPLEGTKLMVCGLGYFDCRIDGRPVSDGLLMPGETQFDVRWRYRVFALPSLAAGRHVLSITVGDGLYRTSTKEVWHFDKASWMDYPKAFCELTDADGRVVVQTDPSWRWRPSPTVFSSLRGGETYDAREAFPETEVPDGEPWKAVAIVAPPGGIAEEEAFPPCRVTKVFPMRRRGETQVWESPEVLAGNVRLTVRGARGAKVVMTAAERLTADGNDIELYPIRVFTDIGLAEKDRTFQRDAYVLSGDGVESWSPRFTYHGFRYVKVEVEGEAEVLGLEALEIHNDFARLGRVEAADARLNRVANACERSILSNFHNIPTDCPTREKNGWTSEARIICEAALYAFDSGSAWAAYADLVGDTQRPSGQISALAPNAGWGYNWGNGPAWDTALLEIPDDVYRFTGDRRPIERLYPKMVRYLDFSEGMLDADGVPSFGLGDWVSASTNTLTTCVRAAFRYRNLDYGVRFARLLGHEAEAARLAERRAAAAEAFRRVCCGPDGLSPEKTSLPSALMLEFGLVRDEDRARCAARLAEIVSANGARVDYGTIGSRTVLRALFENGYADLAYRVMTQPDRPGYAYLTDTLGMTTLPERWDIDVPSMVAESSLNHGAFGDYLAVLYRELGGFRHPFDRPGRDYVEIRPFFPKDLKSFKAEHEGFVVSWKRTADGVEVVIDVPPGKTADFVDSDGLRRPLTPGRHRLNVRIQHVALSGSSSPLPMRRK